MNPRRARRAGTGILLLALSLLACADLSRFVPRGGLSTAYSQEELREELGDFASRFQLVVGSIADEIAASDANRAIKRSALLWRIRVVPLVQEAAFEPNPQAAYVSTLTLIVLMRHYVTEGEARSIFGEHQQRVIDTTRDIESDLVRIGARFMGPEQMEVVRAEVEDFARRRPVPGREFAIQSLGRTLQEVEGTNVFAQVAQIPLSPFRALGGVGDSPAAIRDFTVTAREFIRVAERLPELVRWQLELLLYDVEDRETVMESLSVMRSLAVSAEQVSQTAAQLPTDLQTLLVNSQGTLDRIERVMREAREVAAPVSASAQSLELASASWASILAREEVEEPRSPEPFDIGDWQDTAREIGRAADRLRELAVELRELSASTAALRGVGATLDRADVSARGWIDLAAWRVLQLLIALFVLLGLYRWLSSRLAGPREG